jgi:hypothetical protein
LTVPLLTGAALVAGAGFGVGAGAGFVAAGAGADWSGVVVCFFSAPGASPFAA